MKIYVETNSQQPYVDHLIIACSDLSLGEEGSARFTVIYETASDIQINCTNVMLAGEDYKNWGDSDQYVVDYILNKLEFVQKQ